MPANTREGQELRFDQLKALHMAIPHNQALGLELLDARDGWARFRLPYRPELVGDPRTGALHDGAITSLLDATFGFAGFMALPSLSLLATLDLRIDYLRPSIAKEAVFAFGECYRLTRHVAFVRGFAYHDDESQQIASGAATFMITARKGLFRDGINGENTDERA